MRAYQIPKGGAGIESVVQSNVPIPSRAIARCW